MKKIVKRLRKNGNLSFLNKTQARMLLKGVDVYNTSTKLVEKF